MSSEQSREYSPIDENFNSLTKLLRSKNWDEAFKLINNHEEVATMVNRSRETALHWACVYSAPLRIIDLLLRLNPHAIKAKNDLGELPLHKLFVYKPADPVVVQRMIAADPSAVKVQGYFDDLPLHFAARVEGMPVESFRILLAAYQEGVKVTNDTGELPLHRACKWLLKHDDLCQILTLLMKANPNAVTTPDNRGRHPFHHMMEEIVLNVGGIVGQLNPESMRGLKMVLGAAPSVVSTPCPFFNGGLPLHYLLNKPLSTENSFSLWSQLITFLLEAHPGAVNFANSDGQHPLHIVCRKLPLHCADILAMVLGANPDVLIVVDNKEKTPLDYACKRDDANAFISAIFSASPNGILLKKIKHSCATNQRVSVAYAMAMKELRAERKFNQCLSEKIAALEAAKEKKRRFSF